ncbi:hypothetical protein Ppa06_13980 [Planomonospora parontospora subsp. parontospora]|uniref:Uncharacterized protein n=2 Tax=Planomonospora parontospora TaxID=58119 RepID=A0AA37F2Q9_9ACTN|nr:hypothetical protein [Planomonospora parontospora]GGK53725.1 hypothetical protein GCM10010126_11590 [Planomonospora parontospora]GII07600.1 hypothetical protein Ppa06_13980 [Planomonospora parontospora subsp. parontospora]
MYQVLLGPIAEERTTELPEEALRPLAEPLVLLEIAPWSGRPYNPADPKANMLTHAFGERGLATYIALGEQREVYLIRIEWP